MRWSLRFGLAALFALPRVALAHDVWITLDGDAAQRQVVVNYGHPDDRPPAFVDKIVDLVAVRTGGDTSLREGLSLVEQRGAMVARAKPFADDSRTLFAARYDNGYWVKTSGGFVNATRRSVPGATESVWSGKFAKAVSGPDAPWSRVLGHDLEMVPLSDPARVVPGGTLRLRVLFRGAPLAHVAVERGDGMTAVPEPEIPRFTTDGDGVAAVPIVNAGPTLLVVDHRVSPSLTPDQADADIFNATLWMMVAK
jgi:uncharacterized GH25 family protein